MSEKFQQTRVAEESLTPRRTRLLCLSGGAVGVRGLGTAGGVF